MSRKSSDIPTFRVNLQTQIFSDADEINSCDIQRFIPSFDFGSNSTAKLRRKARFDPVKFDIFDILWSTRFEANSESINSSCSLQWSYLRLDVIQHVKLSHQQQPCLRLGLIQESWAKFEVFNMSFRGQIFDNPRPSSEECKILRLIFRAADLTFNSSQVWCVQCFATDQLPD